jgi:hypothetical protein
MCSEDPKPPVDLLVQVKEHQQRIAFVKGHHEALPVVIVPAGEA